MAEWYRMSNLKEGEQLEFQPKGREGKENFSIWNNKDKKYIKGGEFLMTSKGKQEVNKYIKLTDEEKNTFRRSLKFNWEVLINGEDWFLPLPTTASKALIEQMSTVKQLGKEPLEFTYVLKKEGTGLKTKYYVRIGTEKGLPSGVKKEEVVTVTRLDLSDMEQQYVKALKDYDKYPQAKDYSNEERVQVLVQKLGITEERGRQIVKENF